MLLNCIFELVFNKVNYYIETSYNYYNIFKEQLYINIMPNEFLRQEYMTQKNGFNHINDIMINFVTIGKIKLLNLVTKSNILNIF